MKLSWSFQGLVSSEVTQPMLGTIMNGTALDKGESSMDKSIT